MLMPRISVVLLFSALCLPLAACSGGNRQADTPANTHDQIRPAPSNPGISLPEPSELPRTSPPRTSSYVETDLVKHGYDYLTDQPYDNITELSNSMQFDAAWTGGLSGAAYCIYGFFLEGYDRDSVIRYGWTVEPDPLGSAWIGLSNWSTNSWHWWQCDDTGEFQFGDSADYIRPADSHLYMAVVVAGTGTSELRYLRVGESEVTADLAVTPTGGVAPLEVSFDPNGSTTPVGNIVYYKWDWDGDGEADQEGPDPTVSHEYQGDNTSAGLTVVNSYGEEATTVIDLPVHDPWLHTWGGDLDERLNDIATDGQAIYAVGSSTSFSDEGDSSVVLLKYGLDGTYEWARLWDGTNTDVAHAISINSNGDVFTVGSTASFGAGSFDVLLQRWDSNGELLWTRTWGGIGTDQGYGIQATGDAVYVCGKTGSFLDSADDAVLIAYDLGGNIMWESCFGGSGGPDAARDIQTNYNVILGETIIHLVGDTDAYDDNTEILYATYNTEGEMLSSQTWGEGEDARGNCIAVSGVIGPPERYIVGRIDSGIHYAALLLTVETEPLVRKWGGVTDHCEARAVLNFNNKIYVAGQNYEDVGSDGFICTFSETGALEQAIHLSDWDNYVSFHGLTRFPGSGFIYSGYADSPWGEWSAESVSITSIDVAWESRPLSDYVPTNPAMGTIVQQAEDITEAKHDGNGEWDYGEVLLGVVAQ